MKGNAMTERAHKAKLTDAQRAYVVRRLAADESPSQIARDLQAFGISITRKSVQHYHPGRTPAGQLAPQWKLLFLQTEADLSAAAQRRTRE
jgi:hypothetical protein